MRLGLCSYRLLSILLVVDLLVGEWGEEYRDSEIVLTTSSSLLQGGETALMTASSWGYLDVVRLLLAQGANVNLQDSIS